MHVKLKIKRSSEIARYEKWSREIEAQNENRLDKKIEYFVIGNKQITPDEHGMILIYDRITLNKIGMIMI